MNFESLVHLRYKRNGQDIRHARLKMNINLNTKTFISTNSFSFTHKLDKQCNKLKTK